VRGRADDLDASFVRLQVRTSAGERRQERVMDVDHAFLPFLHQPCGQHAHVASEDDDVDAGVAEQPAEGALLRVALVADGKVVKGNVEPRDEIRLCIVIRRNHDDLTGELTERGAGEKIREAVSLLRREDGDARPSREIVQRPCHVELLGDGSERGTKAVEGRVDVELDALEEQRCGRVGVLVGLDDVAVARRDERSDGGNDARSVCALEEKHGPQRRIPRQKSVRSGSASPRSCVRSTSTHATPLLSA
jgi:hypothetical protein